MFAVAEEERTNQVGEWECMVSIQRTKYDMYSAREVALESDG